jgi:hypothetical protein
LAIEIWNLVFVIWCLQFGIFGLAGLGGIDVDKQQNKTVLPDVAFFLLYFCFGYITDGSIQKQATA